MPTPRVAAIHDLSGFGRCSLTVAIPVLSAMGVQCCPLPTAVLSTHTGGFEGYTFRDLTEEMTAAAAHWKALDLRFDAVYSGFLGSERQIDLVRQFLRDFRRPGTLAVVDPVMGDFGRVYATYTPAMCRRMADLTAEADVITPNLTEAALLLGVPYESLPRDEAGLKALTEKLGCLGRRSVTLTGVSLAEGKTGAMCYDAGKNTCRPVQGGPGVSRHRGCLRQRPHRGIGPGGGAAGRRRPGHRLHPSLRRPHGGGGHPPAGGRGF